MKWIGTVSLAWFVPLALALASSVSAKSVAPGDSVADFSLRNYDGTVRSLSQYHDSTAVVALFIAAYCHHTNAYAERIAKLANAYQRRGFQFLGINSDSRESAKQIIRQARQKGFTFPVLKDSGNVIADRFGAMHTPEVYVISPERVILYHGRIDDNFDADLVQTPYLKDALDAILAGKAIPHPQTHAAGCPIRRVIRG